MNETLWKHESLDWRTVKQSLFPAVFVLCLLPPIFLTAHEAPSPLAANVVEHGVAAPTGRGFAPTAVIDGQGRRVIVTKLAAGGQISYLIINAETGNTEQVYPGLSGMSANTLLVTPENVAYDTVGQRMVALDIDSRTVRILGRVQGTTLGGGMTRAPGGTVWVGIYPSATLVSFCPSTDTFTDHGPMHEADWPMYLRPVAVDSSGWVYGGIGMDRMQIFGFHPATGERRDFVPEEQRFRGYAPNLYLGTDGHVYGRADRFQFGSVLEIHEDGWGWHRLFEGQATPVDEPAPPVPSGRNRFPDGTRFSGINIPDRVVNIHDKDADGPRQVSFDFESSGVQIYTLVAGPDGKIYGATGNPLRFWCYDPEEDSFWDQSVSGGGGHLNQLVRQGNKLYAVSYSRGAVFEYDPFKPYDERRNPRRVHDSDAAFDLYGRPRVALAHPDGRQILVSGNAARVLLGSGLLVYDIKTESGRIIDRADLVPDQAIWALAVLPGGHILAGTSIRPPTAGEAGPATTALLYRYDLESQTVVKQWTLEPDSPAVRDLVTGPDGRIYGLAEPNRLLIFDPQQDAIVRDEPIEGYGAVSGFQAPRCLLVGPEGALYALFREAVVRIDPQTLEHTAIARPEAPITVGIAILDGRLYFGSGPRLFSCALEPSENP